MSLASYTCYDCGKEYENRRFQPVITSEDHPLCRNCIFFPNDETANICFICDNEINPEASGHRTCHMCELMFDSSGCLRRHRCVKEYYVTWMQKNNKTVKDVKHLQPVKAVYKRAVDQPEASDAVDLEVEDEKDSQSEDKSHEEEEAKLESSKSVASTPRAEDLKLGHPTKRPYEGDDDNNKSKAMKITDPEAIARMKRNRAAAQAKKAQRPKIGMSVTVSGTSVPVTVVSETPKKILQPPTISEGSIHKPVRTTPVRIEMPSVNPNVPSQASAAPPQRHLTQTTIQMIATAKPEEHQVQKVPASVDQPKPTGELYDKIIRMAEYFADPKRADVPETVPISPQNQNVPAPAEVLDLNSAPLVAKNKKPKKLNHNTERLWIRNRINVASSPYYPWGYTWIWNKVRKDGTPVRLEFVWKRDQEDDLFVPTLALFEDFTSWYRDYRRQHPAVVLTKPANTIKKLGQRLSIIIQRAMSSGPGSTDHHQDQGWYLPKPADMLAMIEAV
jgi:hypothetical protein